VSSPFAAAFAAARSRSDWNARLEHWEKPASDSEEAQIERAAGMVRGALLQSSWLVAEGVQVRAQGSYHNNTNIRLDSDMDLCACHPSAHVDYGGGLSPPLVDAALGYVLIGRTIGEVVQRLRLELANALSAQFGAQQVTQGSKALTVAALPGSRAPVDVVPALRLHCVRRTGIGLASSMVVVEGIIIFGTDGSETWNFPAQHHENGKQKRARTGLRFKKLVRSLKRLRDELVEAGYLGEGRVPSFLIESLTYRVEDGYFTVEADDRYDRLRRVLYRMGEQMADPLFVTSALEVNDFKLLFGAHQPWSADNARGFVRTALWRLEA
jgi:hypothetical protein